LLPPDALLERLDRRLDFLVGGPRDLPERQQALRRTIQWSYDLLDTNDRRVFGELGIFVGSFSLAAAQAVREFTCDYVGQTPLAKGYGTFPTFHVRRCKART